MTTIKKIQEVPWEFQQRDRFRYPEDNEGFETWLMENINEDEIESNRVYLPISFTAFFKLNNYGLNKVAIKRLQDFIDSLSRDQKYWAVWQYDDINLIDWKDLDVFIFSMGRKPLDYQLPLLCSPHNYGYVEYNRYFRYSFIGRETNPIRKVIFETAPSKADVLITFRSSNMHDYCKMMSNSIFGLCPAGYSPNSFRISECLQMGTIPVIIADDYTPPHYLPIDSFAIKIAECDANRIDQILREVSWNRVNEFRKVLPVIYNEYFTFQSNKKLILEHLKQLANDTGV